MGEKAESEQDNAGNREETNGLPRRCCGRHVVSVCSYPAFATNVVRRCPPLLMGDGLRQRLAAQPAASNQAQNHRAERRDEAQRGIAAAISNEGSLAREEIEEPGIECPGQIA